MSIAVRISFLGLLAYGALEAAPSATTTTLEFSANPIASGQVATLTATVHAGAPVTPGLVTFTDGKVPLGAAQLSTDGTARLPVRLGLGPHSIKAKFAGTKSYNKSSSSEEVLTVSGEIPTKTTLTFSGSPDNYTLVGKVTGSGALPPTGSLGFRDKTNANLSIGTASLSDVARTQTFQQLPGTPAGSYLQGGLIGDLNGDGIPDLTLANGFQAGVEILTGRGDGTLQRPVIVPTDPEPFKAVTGDFNSDGIPDLAVAGNFPGGLNILLGKGDGTFQPNRATSSGYVAALSLTVGDFNNDGIADLAAGDLGSREPSSIGAQAGRGSVVVFLGKGYGTFRAPLTIKIDSPPGSVVSADFNDDGIADLATSDAIDGRVHILLGNGDGTFRVASSYSGSAGCQSLAVADFNHDGALDLATANNDGTIGILLGDGKGRFDPEVTYPVSSSTAYVAASDADGDGNADLLVSNRDDNTVSLLLGRGDGTFGQPTTYDTGQTPLFVAISDLNGDSIPDLAIFNFADGTAESLLGQRRSTATGVLHNVAIFGSGMHEVVAAFQGDGTNTASTSAASAFETTPIRTTLVLSAYPDTVNEGQQIQFTAVLSPTAAYNYTAGGMVSFSTEKEMLGVSPVVNGAATFATTELPAGPHLIIARYSGDANFSGSRSEAIDIKVNAAASAGSSSSSDLKSGQMPGSKK